MIVELELTETEFAMLQVLVERTVEQTYLGSLSRTDKVIRNRFIELSNKMKSIEKEILLNEKRKRRNNNEQINRCR